MRSALVLMYCMQYMITSLRLRSMSAIILADKNVFNFHFVGVIYKETCNGIAQAVSPAVKILQA